MQLTLTWQFIRTPRNNCGSSENKLLQMFILGNSSEGCGPVGWEKKKVFLPGLKVSSH